MRGPLLACIRRSRAISKLSRICATPCGDYADAGLSPRQRALTISSLPHNHNRRRMRSRDGNSSRRPWGGNRGIHGGYLVDMTCDTVWGETIDSGSTRIFVTTRPFANWRWYKTTRKQVAFLCILAHNLGFAARIPTRHRTPEMD